MTTETFPATHYPECNDRCVGDSHYLEGFPSPQMRKVLVSEELFLALGADRVDWGEPDADGFYTPTLYRVIKDD